MLIWRYLQTLHKYSSKNSNQKSNWMFVFVHDFEPRSSSNWMFIQSPFLEHILCMSPAMHGRHNDHFVHLQTLYVYFCTGESQSHMFMVKVKLDVYFIFVSGAYILFFGDIFFKQLFLLNQDRSSLQMSNWMFIPYHCFTIILEFMFIYSTGRFHFIAYLF